METQNYRIHAKLRRQSQAPLEDSRIEFRSEDFESDEEFCLAVATELLETIQADREYLESKEGDENETNQHPGL